MLQNAYLLSKIGADTAENEQHFAEILPIGRLPKFCRFAGHLLRRGLAAGAKVAKIANNYFANFAAPHIPTAQADAHTVSLGGKRSAAKEVKYLDGLANETLWSRRAAAKRTAERSCGR